MSNEYNKLNKIKENSLASRFLQQISKMIDYKLSKISRIESGIVDKINSDGTVDIHLPPDNTVFTKIQNQSIYNLKIGDCVKVIKENNSSSNMWIVGGNKLINQNRSKKDFSKNDIVDMIYPIGSIYMSMNNADPSILFGGKWEQLKDRFLLGVGDQYKANTEGGDILYHICISGSNYGGLQGGANSGEYRGRVLVTQSNVTNTATHARAIQGLEYQTETKTETVDILPPYLTVYMWKRIE